MKLHAAEQDADDQIDGEQDAQDQDDNGAADGGDANSQDQDELEADGEQDDPAGKRRAIEERAESERLARERGELEGQRRAQAAADAQRQREAAEREERELLAAMDEGQRTTYLLAKEVKEAKQGQSVTTLLLQSSSDQNKFSRTLSRKPQYAKFEDEVERRHQDILSRGGFTSREVILAHLIGEKALQAEGTNKQKQQGQRRIQSQRSSNARGARGDAGSTRGNSGKSLIERMEAEDRLI